MAKTIDFSKTVAELVKEFPEAKEILAEIGFKDITNPLALNVMGRVMTVPKGAAIKNISMEKIIAAFEQNGFAVTGWSGASADTQPGGSSDESNKVGAVGNVHSAKTAAPAGSASDRNEQLKALIRRLSSGEDLESVRADFVRDFESVSVHDIIRAEQGLIDDGTPVQDVQKLCDLHSALFHGKTEAEVMAEENQSLLFALEEGHPVQILMKENAALKETLDALEKALAENAPAEEIKNRFAALKKIRVLYGKKEELIMPPLYRYGVKGPSDVMWGVDDEIKAEVSRLAKELCAESFDANKGAIRHVLDRMTEMIYKEESILFPLALDRLTEDEWIAVYRDLPEMGNAFITQMPRWEKAEKILAEQKAAAKQHQISDGVIHFESGELTLNQLKAIFKLLPVDITFIDENETNRFFTNEGKVFSRPLSALGRPVYDCHPPRIVPMVKSMIAEFKAGTRDTMEMWTPNPQNPIRVLYCAVRDETGGYLGTVEIVQQFKDVLEHLAPAQQA